MTPYGKLLAAHILPTFGNVPVRRLSPAAVREWHAKTALSTSGVFGSPRGVRKRQPSGRVG